MVVVAVCLRFSEDGVVTGPEWSVERSTVLVREMRKATPSPGLQDLLVLARIFHELFEEKPESWHYPVLSRHEHDKSLTQAMLDPSTWDDLPALERAEAEDILAASNVARWVLRLPQQPSPFVVFVEELPPDLNVVLPRQCPGIHAPLRLAPSG